MAAIPQTYTLCGKVKSGLYHKMIQTTFAFYNGPPGDSCALMLDRGWVHHGPPRSTHSIGDISTENSHLWVAKLKTLTKHPLANEVKLSKKIQNGTLFNFISIKDIPRRIVTNVSGMRINGPRQNISDRIFGIKSILHWMVFAAMICHSRN